MSDPHPHNDTGYDAGLAVALSLVGFFFVMAIFFIPYTFDESWVGTYRTTYAYVQPAKPAKTVVVAQGVPVPPSTMPPPTPVAMRPPALVASAGGSIVACPNLSGLKA